MAANGQSNGLKFKPNIGPLSCVSVYEGDSTCILTASATLPSVVAIWPDKSPKESDSTAIFRGHTAGITSIAFAPKSGNFFVTGSIDRNCRLWRWSDDSRARAPSSALFSPLNRDSSTINSVDVSSNETIFASGGKDHTISIWDVNNNKQSLRSIRSGGGWVSHVQFNPSSPTVLLASTRGILVMIDTRQNYKETILLQNPSLTVCAWQDEYNLVFGCGMNSNFMDVRNPSKNSLFGTFKSPINSFAFDSHRRTLAVANKNGLYLYPIVSGFKTRKGPKPTGEIAAIAYSQLSDKLILAESSGTLTILPSPGSKCVTPAATPTPTPEPKSHTPPPLQQKAKCSSQSEVSATLKSQGSSNESLCNGYDEITEETIVKNQNELVKKQNAKASTSRPIYETKVNGKTVYSASLSPDGKTIVSGCSNGSLICWKAEQRKSDFYPGHTNEVRTTDFAPNGSYIVSGSDDSRILLWSVNDSVVNPQPHKFAGHVGPVKSVHINRESSRFCSGSSDSTVRLWSSERAEAAPFLYASFYSHTSMVNAVRFHPSDSNCIAASAKSSGTLLIDTRMADQTMQLASKDSPNLCLTWHPISPVHIAVGTWTSIRVWDIRNYKEPLQLVVEPYPCLSIAYNPSGTQLITSFHNDSAVKIFSSHTSTCRLEEVSSLLDNHSKIIWAANFNHTGSEIITAGAPGRIAIWKNKFVCPIVETLNSNNFSTVKASNANSNAIPDGKNSIQNLVKATCVSSTSKAKSATITSINTAAPLPIASKSDAPISLSANTSNENTSKCDGDKSVSDSSSTSKISKTNLVTDSKLFEQLVDSKVAPLKKTISQLESKIGQNEANAKRILNDQGEKLKNSEKMINSLKEKVNALERQSSQDHQTEAAKITQQLEATIKKLQSDLDKVRRENTKTCSSVFQLKDQVENISFKLRENESKESLPSSSSSSIHSNIFSSKWLLLAVTAASLISFTYLKKKHNL